jgi:hypothetical protein
MGVVLLSGARAIGPPPTRAQLGAGYAGFQGLTVTVPGYGPLPYFTASLAWMTPAQRAAVYPQLRAAGVDTVELPISGQYSEPPSFSYPIPGYDWSGNLPGYVALTDEAIGQGFKIVWDTAGDGQSQGTPPYGYNDPDGWTYGFQWSYNLLPTLFQALGPQRRAYGWFRPGYDGVFYGWTPDQVNQWGLLCRSLDPLCTIGLEFSIGVCHLGNGIADYEPGGGLYAYDIFQNEFEYSVTAPENEGGLCEIAARLLGPSYVRPPFQPPTEDPDAPFQAGDGRWFAQYGTVRNGVTVPFMVWALEDGEYNWVRNQVSATDIQTEMGVLKAAGYATVS